MLAVPRNDNAGESRNRLPFFLLFRAATIPDYFTAIESDSIVLNGEETQQGIERMAVAG